MTKITSITYVKNGAAYIERCVRSVAKQMIIFSLISMRHNIKSQRGMI